MFTPFANEPYVNFAESGPKERMLAALRKVESELGRRYPLIIGGERVDTPGEIVSTNPARPTQVVGIAASADTALAPLDTPIALTLGEVQHVG